MSGFKSRRGFPCKSCDKKHEKTTMIYTHVLNRGGLAVRSPLD
jgi:hypothetical protein